MSSSMCLRINDKFKMSRVTRKYTQNCYRQDGKSFYWDDVDYDVVEAIASDIAKFPHDGKLIVVEGNEVSILGLLGHEQDS